MQNEVQRGVQRWCRNAEIREGIEGIEKFGKILVELPINSTSSLESKRCSTPFSTVPCISTALSVLLC